MWIDSDSNEARAMIRIMASAAPGRLTVADHGVRNSVLSGPMYWPTP